MGNPVRTRLGVWMAMGLAAWGAACEGTPPGKDIGPPDITKVSVFYPVDGLVPGRGSAGTFADPTVSYVVVNAHPTGTETILPVEQDGSFNFSVLALSDDILEIAGARDRLARERGQVAYIRVPPRAPAYPHYFCCGAGNGRMGTCTNEDQYSMTHVCAESQTGLPQCDSILACRVPNREILPINPARVQVSPPNADGNVSVTGVIESGGALVRLENRGQRALGGRDPGIRLSQISDVSGLFKFKTVTARGDDEIVVQVFDLVGNKSPQLSMLVPDAPLAGLDITGAYPFERLDNGKVGPVAIRFSPYGEDGRGMCPDSTQDPVLCFTGGLTHDMVHIDEITLDDRPLAVPPRPTAQTALRPNNRATEGDPSAGKQNLVVVIDNSMNAAMRDTTPPTRFEAIRQFIRSLRKRDRVGIVSIGSTIARDLEPVDSGGDWARQLGAVAAVADRGANGPTDLFGGMITAAEMLDDLKKPEPGNIVLVALADDTGSETDVSAAFTSLFDKVHGDPASGFRGYGLYIIGVNIPQPVINMGQRVGHLPELASISDFSTDGRFVNVGGPSDLQDALGRAAGYLSGSYVLLYDMAIPDTVGKSARLKITATVAITPQSGAQQTATATYEGPLRIDGSDL